MPFINSVRASYGAQGLSRSQTGRIGAGSTGGTITTAGGYRIHTFTATGASTFTADEAGTVEYLVVAGGAGGAQQHAGGGGAGGLRTGSLSVTFGSNNSLNVGAGGAFQPNVGGCSGHSTPAGNGGSSTFLSITSIGGGYGGSYGGNGVAPFAGPNGSGGGGQQGNNQGFSNAGGPGTAGQGYAGGDSSYNHVGGGGGGAGEAGIGSQTIGGNTNSRSGGNGLQSSISGTATYYAGGGGGGCHNISALMTGGLGGGANGGSKPGERPPTSAVDGTGGGGGSNGECQPNSPTSIAPTRGGHGIVIIRYPV